MDKFLKKYYEQLHFNSMPEGVQAHFFEWVKNGTLTKTMQQWANDYLQHDNTSGNLIVIRNGEYIPNNLPNPNDSSALSEEDARKLFVAFHKAFSGMHAKLSKIEAEDKQTADFVKAYFGPNKLFEPSTANNACKDGIDAIVNLLTNTAPDLQAYIVSNVTDEKNNKVFKRKEDLLKFLKDCSAGKYNSDTSAQEKIVSIANLLSSAKYNIGGEDESVKKDLREIEKIKGHIDAVISEDAFSLDPASVDPSKLRDFRQTWASKLYDPSQPSYSTPGLLQTLYHNKTIRAQFAKYDHGEITGKINDAEEKVNWQDQSKENYVDEIIQDKKTPIQRFQSFVTKTYNDTFRKYEQLRGGSVFFKKEAKYVFDAIDKVGVKPTDGLDGLLKKEKDISGEINNPLAREHFKWFTETMGPIAKKMPEAVKGAWSNGTQMKAVIERIILEATKPGASEDAVEKAKTAMEIMIAMKYGMMTSKIMDAMENTDFNVLSDKDLSWNKNEGIQFVTNAFDKSVKFAFKTVGFGITIARNKIMMRKGKTQFTNDDNSNDSELGRAFQQHNQAQKDDLRSENKTAIGERRRIKSDIRGLGADYTGRGAITARKNDRTNAQHDMQAAETAMAGYQANYDLYEEADKTIQEHSALVKNQGEIKSQLAIDQAKLAAKKAELANPETYKDLPAPAANVQAQKIQQEIEQLEANISNAQKQLSQLDDEINGIDISAAYTTKYNMAISKDHDSYIKEQEKYDKAKEKYDELDDKISQFEQGKARIRELNQQIRDRQDALDNWPEKNNNKILELENYWNWLQTGETKTWRISTNNAQKKFDQNKQALYANYVSSYGLAA